MNTLPVNRLVAATAVAYVALFTSCLPAAFAQPSWEYSPYRMLIWTSVADSLPLPTNFASTLTEEFSRRVDVTMKASWQVESESPPAQLEPDLDGDFSRLTVETIAVHAPQALESDKLVQIWVGGSRGDFRIRVRELDCRTRTFGPTVERVTRLPDQIATQTFLAVLDSFAAVVRIESGERNALVVRVRAGGLILDTDSPAFVGQGDVLQPIVRRNDRLGRPTAIDVVDWTYLEVTGRDAFNPNLLTCRVHSAWRSPIRGRVSARREQYALAIRPSYPTTELVVEADVARTDQPYALEGLEIFSKRLGVTEEGVKSPPQFLGVTNWRGAVNVARNDVPLQLIYVKNGGRLLARLPLVSGMFPALYVQLPDDDPRLQAEGSVHGFNAQLMDLIAQRKILATGIRQRIQDGKVEEAQHLVERFAQLPTQNDMRRRLDQHRRRQESSSNRMVQSEIELLYAEARKALAKFLDPSLGSTLRREVQNAQ